MKMKKIKAVVLYSGGLDSILAVKLLQEQGIEVIALNFKLPISCSFEKMIKPDCKLDVIDCTKGEFFNKYTEMLRKPKFGYGSSVNPCKDCKIFMFKLAKKYAEENKTDIIASGEVLGERPMSQTHNSLRLIEEEAGLKGKILRPLSAKVLEETEYEKSELVDRKKLEGIQGRRRERQIELAEKFKLKFPSPAGGCILTEKEFKPRLNDLFLNKKEIELRDIELLKIGRHFRVNGKKLIIARDKEECEKLLNFAGFDLIIEPSETAGPTALLEKTSDLEIIKKSAEIVVRYIPVEKEAKIKINNKIISVFPLNKEEIEEFKIN